MFESGEITSVEELAHIVGEKVGGPRGDRSLPLNQRDQYHNILVLCPYCHTLIDKNPNQFPDELLLGWKANHEAEIDICFGVPHFQNRAELNMAVFALLIENRKTFETYGPFSEKRDVLLTDAAGAWERSVGTTIIPNNRRIWELSVANRHLLDEDELDVMQAFRLHKEAFEYNHLSGDKNALAPLFPKEMNSIFEATNA